MLWSHVLPAKDRLQDRSSHVDYTRPKWGCQQPLVLWRRLVYNAMVPGDSLHRHQERGLTRLNLPILDQVGDCRNLLGAGMGGGVDASCGLPVYFELQVHGVAVRLASFGFAEVASLPTVIRLTETLVGVTHEFLGPAAYFPELCLARWFKQERDQAVTLWCFHQTGTKPLLDNYRVFAPRRSGRLSRSMQRRQV